MTNSFCDKSRKKLPDCDYYCIILITFDNMKVTLNQIKLRFIGIDTNRYFMIDNNTNREQTRK